MRFLIVIFLLITSCSTDMNINDFSGKKPKFKLEEYFNGKTEAWGMFHDRFGNLLNHQALTVHYLHQQNNQTEYLKKLFQLS